MFSDSIDSISVVGRFVHHQDVWLLHHQLTEQHMRPFSPPENYLRRLFDIVLATAADGRGCLRTACSSSYQLLAHHSRPSGVVFELVLMVLRVVAADLRVFQTISRCRCPAAVRLPGFFQHGGFTHAVGARMAIFSPFQQQVDVFEQRTFIKAFGRGASTSSALRNSFLSCSEADKWVLTAGPQPLQLDFVNLARAKVA